MNLFAKFGDNDCQTLIFDVMGIFDDEDTHMKNTDSVSIIHGCDKRIKNIQFEYVNQANLTADEYGHYCRYLSKVDAFHNTSIPGLPNFGVIRNEVNVIFSAHKPSYAEKYKDKRLSNILVLGEYDNSDNTIYIYIDNIKCVCKYEKSDINRLMLAVYVHELYHAYFNCGIGHRYIREIEEPLAEFGALFCLEAMTAMGIVEYDDLIYYIKEVADKKEVLPEYSFGEHIYMHHHMLRSDFNMGNLIENYKNSVINDKSVSLISSDNISQWETAYNNLKKALNYVD